MDLRQLKYFKTIVDEGSITHAANKLHMAQPPLSQQLKRLEVELNTILIKRYRSDWEITETGRMLYEYAKKTLLEMEHISNEILMVEEGVKGTLAIGVSSSCLKLLPKVVKSFRNKYPNVYIKIYEGDSSYLENLLANHKIELALMVLPLNTQRYHVIKLHAESFKVVMPIKWYEDRCLDVMSLENLNDYPILMLGPMDGYFAHETILNYFTSKNLEPNIVLECKDVFTLLNFVAEEVGIAVLPQSEVHTVFENGVKSLSIENVKEEITPCIISINDYPLTTIANKFTDEFQTYIVEQ
ncbi:LysR family transcriptional regulator [Bacillus sp. N3536]|nr:LysR family transcriptional regulator [Bacillus sp. N3536]